MSKRADIARRIESLLNKRQEKGATVEEAYAARRKALDLIRRYGFTRQEFGIHPTDLTLPDARETVHRDESQQAPISLGRIAALDVVRGVAIGAMVVYHLSYDLRAEGLIAADVVNALGWRVFARTIAGTFLFLVGVNLVLATRRGLSSPHFLRRLGLIAGGALIVTLATWWFNPRTFVFFGILHMIALASVLALPFLRLPTWAVVVAAVVVFVAPRYVAAQLFDAPALWWLGLSTTPPASVDYVPVFPWFAVVLAGIAAGRWLIAYSADGPFARWRPTAAAGRWVVLAGQWSLAIYLVHQPILVGAVAIAARLVPPSETVIRQDFVHDCVTACRTNGRSQSLCAALCDCAFTELYRTDLFEATSVELLTPEQRQRWDAIIAQCSAQAPAAPPAE